jgi:hypothetical protein
MDFLSGSFWRNLFMSRRLRQISLMHVMQFYAGMHGDGGLSMRDFGVPAWPGKTILGP